jgi:hypothetical protein
LLIAICNDIRYNLLYLRNKIMADKPNPASEFTSVMKASRLPMVVIALAQIQMGFNVYALPVSIGGIVEDFNTSPSSVSTALVAYSLAVAGFVLL